MKKIIKIIIGAIVGLHILPLSLIGNVMITGITNGHSYLYFYFLGLTADMCIILLFGIIAFILWCFDLIDL